MTKTTRKPARSSLPGNKRHKDQRVVYRLIPGEFSQLKETLDPLNRDELTPSWGEIVLEILCWYTNRSKTVSLDELVPVKRHTGIV